jgi:hypothetical protein
MFGFFGALWRVLGLMFGLTLGKRAFERLTRLPSSSSILSRVTHHELFVLRERRQSKAEDSRSRMLTEEVRGWGAGRPATTVFPMAGSDG